MKLHAYFERRTRDNGDAFYTLRDGAPEWLADAIRDAHASDMPCDWVYGVCHSVACAIDEGWLKVDTIPEFADGECDTYTRALYQWAADMCLSYTFANAESRAADIGTAEDTIDRLRSIQFQAIEHIAETILEAYISEGSDDE